MRADPPSDAQYSEGRGMSAAFCFPPAPVVKLRPGFMEKRPAKIRNEKVIPAGCSCRNASPVRTG